MSKNEYELLAEDIHQNGLREPIWLYEGKIIDGRNRYKACRELGLEPAFQNLETEFDPLGFVISMNLRRRHLSESQRAMVAGRLANMPAHRPNKSANLQTSVAQVSQTEAAEVLHISPRSVADAVDILKNGTSSLLQQHVRESRRIQPTHTPASSLRLPRVATPPSRVDNPPCQYRNDGRGLTEFRSDERIIFFRNCSGISLNEL